MMTKTIKVEGPVHVVCHCDKCKAQPQRTWVGLTDEEIDKIRSTPMSVENGVGFNIYTYARAIEAKLKQKNGYAEEKNT